MRTLVGAKGYVGSSLLTQQRFDLEISRENFELLTAFDHDEVVFCSAPAQKWLANKNPIADLENINFLISAVARTRAKRFVLISTVDVYKSPVAVDESHPADAASPNFYGLHRRMLEDAVRENFTDHSIVRLPGLVGPGLRKNAIYDLAHANNVEALNGASIFQFYPVEKLADDLKIVADHSIPLVHLTAEPIALSQIALDVFSLEINSSEASAVRYDFRSKNSLKFGSNGDYQYSAKQSLEAISKYRAGIE